MVVTKIDEIKNHNRTSPVFQFKQLNKPKTWRPIYVEEQLLKVAIEQNIANTILKENYEELKKQFLNFFKKNNQKVGTINKILNKHLQNKNVDGKHHNCRNQLRDTVRGQQIAHSNSKSGPKIIKTRTITSNCSTKKQMLA